jgi:hypothetical protein
MSFMPNMTPKEIAELDKERGKKFYDEEDHVEPNDRPAKKEPWLTKTPVNKSGGSMSGAKKLREYFGKSKGKEDVEDLLGEEYAEKCMHEDGEDLVKDVSKALSTRSIHIPRPNHHYDPFDIQRSATTATTRSHSGLNGPSGVAPLVGETLADAEDAAKVRSTQDTYKSCNFHRLVYKSEIGCVMCNHTMRKSNMCKTCGDVMEKVAGGYMSCKACV